MIFLADTRTEIADYILAVSLVYTILIIAHIVIQMAFNFGARIPYYRWTDWLFDFLRDVTEPYLRLFRKFVPMIGPLDLSPLVALIVLGVGSGIVADLIAG